MEPLSETANLHILLLIGIAIIILIPLLLMRLLKDSAQQRAQSRDLDATVIGRRKIYNPASVCEILDGSRVIVSCRDSRLILRLNSIECPEDQLGSDDDAKNALANLVGDRDVVFEDHGVDAEGATLATVFVVQNNRWTNVNLRMVKLGFAWVRLAANQQMSKGRRDELRRMERYARSQCLGVWVRTDSTAGSFSWKESALH